MKDGGVVNLIRFKVKTKSKVAMLRELLLATLERKCNSACIAMIYVTKSRTGNYDFRACARARGFPGSTLFGRTHTLRRVCRAITR